MHEGRYPGTASHWPWRLEMTGCVIHLIIIILLDTFLTKLSPVRSILVCSGGWIK